ncbi:MAG: hypothetical protein KBA32_13485, partial [Propionivibrio sp.]|uniref:hypothetical protein n=1 Tax=Propionivibrio sp. TaxID=2212460 RepID=UPI001B63210C
RLSHRQQERETEITDEAHTKPGHDFESVELTTSSVGREGSFLVACRVADSECPFVLSGIYFENTISTINSQSL